MSIHFLPIVAWWVIKRSTAFRLTIDQLSVILSALCGLTNFKQSTLRSFINIYQCDITLVQTRMFENMLAHALIHAEIKQEHVLCLYSSLLLIYYLASSSQIDKFGNFLMVCFIHDISRTIASYIVRKHAHLLHRPTSIPGQGTTP